MIKQMIYKKIFTNMNITKLFDATDLDFIILYLSDTQTGLWKN